MNKTGGTIFSIWSLLILFAPTKNFLFKDYQLINKLIKNTFSNFTCLNLYLSEKTHKSYDLRYLHEMNYSFIMVSFLKKMNQHCGYLFICSDFSELDYFKNLSFDFVPVILFIAEKKTFNLLEIYEKQKKSLQDKDFLFFDLSSSKYNTYRQSRHFSRLESVNINSSTPFFSPRLRAQRLVNYEQRIAKVVTFHCPAFGSIREGVQKNLGDGVETRIFKEVTRRLNLTWQVIVPEDGKRWGTAYPNKTISGGILKYLYKGEADIGFCSLWIERSKFPYMIMSTYWNILCLRFLVPKPKIMSNHLRTIFKPLPLNLWIMIFLSTILTTAVSTVLRYIQRLIKPNYLEETSTISSFITIIGTLVMAKNLNKYEGNNASKHLFLWWSIFALIITSLYSSSLVSHLTYPQHHPMVDTIEGLVEGGYYWGTPYEPPIKYIFNSKNTWHKIFADRFKYEIDTDDRVRRILSGKYAVFVKCIGNEHFMEVHDVPNNILHDLRAPRTCLNYFYLGFGFRKALPYADDINRIIAALVESGITEYWLNRVFENEYSPTTFAKVYEYKTPPEDVHLRPLTFDNLRCVFFVLFAGVFLSTIVFIGEISNTKFLKIKLNA